MTRANNVVIDEGSSFVMLCLLTSSDAAWADAATRSFDEVLVDHAHCEMKAASNALSLAARHPERLGLVRALTDLAKEEIDHFQRVIAFLERRGLALGPPQVDGYAAELRRAAAAAPTKLAPLVDRLLVGALIEARSCERFKLLLERLPEDGTAEERELRAFYTELFACEARHYRTFVDLAADAAGEAAQRAGEVDARLEELARAEAAIVDRLAAAPPVARRTVHG